MEQETAELLDKILIYLENGKVRETELNILTYLEIDVEKGEKLFRRLKTKNYINERLITGTNKRIVYISDTGKDFIHTSSFFRLYIQETKEQTRTTIHDTTLIITSIFTIVGIISSIILGVISYRQNETIKEKDKKIEILSAKIESLTTKQKFKNTINIKPLNANTQDFKRSEARRPSEGNNND